jgi:ubiquinone/menaquinone biosynthesis C-methylase UbiE
MVRVCREVEPLAPFLLDVGAGTGISTRALADVLGPDWRFVGVEPSDDMRRTAQAQSAAYRNIAFQSGAAEALPFEAGEIGAILVAQALHWFDRPAFYHEAERLLAPGGALFVLFNDRDDRTTLFQAFEDLMERETPGYSRTYRQFDYAGELRALPWVAAAELREYTWTWRLPYEGFTGLMLSRSMAKPWVEKAGEEAVAEAFDAFIAGYGDGETVELPYVTRLAIARKRED